MASGNIETVTYEILKERLKNKGLQEKTHLIYKNFTQSFLRKHAVQRLIEIIKEIYKNPTQFGTELEVDTLKNDLQHLVAFYSVQHKDQPKDDKHIALLKKELEPLKDFSDKMTAISQKYLEMKSEVMPLEIKLTLSNRGFFNKNGTLNKVPDHSKNIWAHFSKLEKYASGKKLLKNYQPFARTLLDKIFAVLYHPAKEKTQLSDLEKIIQLIDTEINNIKTKGGYSKALKDAHTNLQKYMISLKSSTKSEESVSCIRKRSN